ncbi:MFS transporter [Zobellella denitrificans]|uniref:MFS transporter n=1 Tax=Zobellella denitrificans TaxID=347534 RepID=UPI000B8C508B|nr:MFS transporter [Zobellella denitrificans]OXS15420.1 MFS transporter [Zobellella denitrificans]
MKLKPALIAITLLAVVFDTMLLPFYPQFFEGAYGERSPHHVGFYIGAICLTVMLAFPVWAWVAKKIAVLKLLVYTQLVAGTLGIWCYFAETLAGFWVLSLTMLVFKASYLLIYPYVMSLEHQDKHGGTIGLLSVIVHLGSIAGAVLGGTVLQFMAPRDMFLVMPLGDFIQVGICLLLLSQGRHLAAAKAAPAADAPSTPKVPGLVLRLGLIMLVFYFSAFLVRPFFSRYWEAVSGLTSPMVSGAVYAIPGLVAFVALWVNHRTGKGQDCSHGAIVSAIALGLAGLLLQAAPQPAVVLAGRVLYGWALFQAMVRLDLLLFRFSTPADYATDFSKVHFCQNLGVLLSSFAAGSLVVAQGLTVTFFAAALGFLASIALYSLTLRTATRAAPDAVATP